jgi:hypothetical protein
MSLIESDINLLEQNLVDRLQLKIDQLVIAGYISAGDIEVELWPEALASFKRPVKKIGRISVCYLDSTYDRVLDPNVVSQTGTVSFGFHCQGKLRRGVGGVNDLIRIVLKYLIGYQPLGYTKMIAKNVKLYEREKDSNQWMALAELSTNYILSEFNDDPTPPNIEQMVFNPPAGTGASTTVNANTVIGGNPIS